MANDNFIGNCSRLNWKGRSDGMRGILGIKTTSPVPHPVIMVHSIMCDFNDLICKRVPLHNFGGLRFRNKITGHPTFKLN